jgi:HPt (histidine-containing phosphotransfer) domain-containing protein
MNRVDTTHERDAGLLTSIVDAHSALKRLGDDWELFDQIVQISLEDAPLLVHAAREALAGANAKELRRAAHSLKSLMATLGATPASNSAMTLEKCATSGDLAPASDLIRDCGDNVAAVCRALQAYCDSGAPAGSGASG